MSLRGHSNFLSCWQLLGDIIYSRTNGFHGHCPLSHLLRVKLSNYLGCLIQGNIRQDLTLVIQKFYFQLGVSQDIVGRDGKPVPGILILINIKQKELLSLMVEGIRWNQLATNEMVSILEWQYLSDEGLNTSTWANMLDVEQWQLLDWPK